MAHNGAYQLPEGMVGLPVLVATPSDIGRLLRELETVENAMLQSELGGKQAAAPKLTNLMDQTVQLNKIDVTKPASRKAFQDFLTNIKKSAPVLHISFSADPTVPFMEKLASWLRREIHPLVLVTIGLQPNLGAGCVVRSTNKYFDLSLRKNFANSKGILIAKLDEINGLPPEKPQDAAAVEPQAEKVAA